MLSRTMTRQTTLTPRRAVVIGQLVVNVPVLALIVLGYVIARVSMGPSKAIFGVPVGIALAWLWWSAVVPRWREWASTHGADRDQTQHLAEKAGLVWPKGSPLERTEFRPRKRG
jgi:hypothetical protein